MYSFAIWDTERRRLLVARDRFGEKPLVYRSSGGRLTFASELTALQGGLESADAVDPVSLSAYLALGYVPGPRSMVSDVDQLPPACLLTWSSANPVLQVSRYWRMPASSPAATGSLEEMTTQLDGRFAGAVRSRVIADVPVGVLLSGGVDSTLVAADAARASRGPIQTFTVGYHHGDVDETAAARRVATVLGAAHREMVLTPPAVAEQVPGLLRRLDQPVADPALVALHAVCGFAREHVTVALGGEGADEIFAGYPRYRWLAISGRIARVAPAPLRAAGARALKASALRGPVVRLADVLGPGHVVERHVNWSRMASRVVRSRCAPRFSIARWPNSLPRCPSRCTRDLATSTCCGA